MDSLLQNMWVCFILLTFVDKNIKKWKEKQMFYVRMQYVVKRRYLNYRTNTRNYFRLVMQALNSVKSEMILESPAGGAVPEPNPVILPVTPAAPDLFPEDKLPKKVLV